MIQKPATLPLQHVGVEPILCGWPSPACRTLSTTPMDVPSVCPSPRRACLTQSALGLQRPRRGRQAGGRAARTIRGYRSGIAGMSKSFRASCPSLQCRADVQEFIEVVCGPPGETVRGRACLSPALSTARRPKFPPASQAPILNHSSSHAGPSRQAECS
jgi:ribosome modulation factor